MGKSKKIVITLIVVLLIVLIGIGGAFTYAYLATDLLKSDKELFFKYLSQISAEENGFIDANIAKFQEKKKQNIYENSGDFTFTAEIPEEIEDTEGKVFDKVNELSIKFSGKSNGISRKSEQSIEIDYGNDVIFPVNYRQDGDIFGLQTKYVGSKYIAIENNNLKDLAQKLGMDDLDIQDKIELEEQVQDFKFTPEELEQIKQTYGSVLDEQLTKENFSRVQTTEGVEYTLTLSGEQTKNLVIKLLETLKQDKMLINKINKDMEKKIIESSEYITDASVTVINEESIQSMIDEIQDSDISEWNDLKITVGQKDKFLNKILIEYDSFKILIAKNEENEQLSYQLSIQGEQTEESTIMQEESTGKINMYVNLTYSGLQNLNNVQENNKFGFEFTSDNETIAYEYNFNNTTKFTDMAQIDGLNENTALILNDYDSATVQNLITKIGERLTEVNKMQMEQLGLKESENPLIYSNPLTIGIGMLFGEDGVITNAKKAALNNKEGTVTDEEKELQDAASQMLEMEKRSFNEKFTRYQGTNQSGALVNALISEVLMNNMNYQDDDSKIVKVTLNGNEFLDGNETSIPSKVETTKKYTIAVMYNDDTGLINEIQITTEN